MRPTFTHREATAEQAHTALLIGAAHVDDRALQLGLEIRRKVRRNGTSLRGLFLAATVSRPMCRNVGTTQRLQMSEVAHLPTLPYFAKPQRVIALYRVLQSRFARWSKHRCDPQAQAQSADTTHCVGVLMRALKLRAVVELCIRGQAIAPPAFEQPLEDESRFSLLQGPRIDQTTVQRGAVENPDQRTVCDLELLNQIEAVELCLATRQRRQIPALRRRGTTYASRAILQPCARKCSVNRRNGGHAHAHLSAQSTRNRFGSVFAQHTFFAKTSAKLNNALFYARADAIPAALATRLAIGELHALEPTLSSTCHPERDRALTDPQLLGYRFHALARAHQSNYLAPLLFRDCFLAMSILKKADNRTSTPSTIAETSAIDDR